MALIHLIYVSSAIGELSSEQLKAIMASSVRHNLANGLTGLLLYRRGSFMQVLEGEQATVVETYRRIARDTRHFQLIELVREQIAERSFERWSMGFRELDDSDLVSNPAFAPLLAEGFDAQAIGAKPGRALTVMKSFC